jgi:hypothetical protein
MKRINFLPLVFGLGISDGKLPKGRKKTLKALNRLYISQSMTAQLIFPIFKL